MSKQNILFGLSFPTVQKTTSLHLLITGSNYRTLAKFFVNDIKLLRTRKKELNVCCLEVLNKNL